MSNLIQQSTPQLPRRTLLQMLTVGATIGLTGGISALLQACSALPQSGQSIPLTNSPSDTGTSAFIPDIEIKLTASQGATQILPGATTATWSYRGEGLKGDATALVNLPDSYLGPILRLRKGQKGTYPSAK